MILVVNEILYIKSTVLASTLFDSIPFTCLVYSQNKFFYVLIIRGFTESFVMNCRVDVLDMN